MSAIILVLVILLVILLGVGYYQYTVFTTPTPTPTLTPTPTPVVVDTTNSIKDDPDVTTHGDVTAVTPKNVPVPTNVPGTTCKNPASYVNKNNGYIISYKYDNWGNCVIGRCNTGFQPNTNYSECVIKPIDYKKEADCSNTLQLRNICKTTSQAGISWNWSNRHATQDTYNCTKQVGFYVVSVHSDTNPNTIYTVQVMNNGKDFADNIGILDAPDVYINPGTDFKTGSFYSGIITFRLQAYDNTGAPMIYGLDGNPSSLELRTDSVNTKQSCADASVTDVRHFSNWDYNKIVR